MTFPPVGRATDAGVDEVAGEAGTVEPGAVGRPDHRARPGNRDRYLPRRGLLAYRALLAERHPWLLRMLDLETPRSRAIVEAVASYRNEFDGGADARGTSYRRAQGERLLCRSTGMRDLAERLVAAHAGPVTVLDVLGGDATFARVATRLGFAGLRVITSDISGDMVDAALDDGLPAVRQGADALLVRDARVGAVLFAYGTHHIAPERRPVALAEAFRVLRDGGRVLLHDFDERAPMAAFFRDVVHAESPGGHPYRHFERGGTARLLARAGFRDVAVHDVYDPLVVTGATAEDAVAGMAAYVTQMYGLAPRPAEETWHLLVRTFRHDERAYREWRAEWLPAPAIRRVGDTVVAEVPRVALVASGRK